MPDWRDVLNPDTGNRDDQGYTGRKLEEYVWIPKPKTDLGEYRLNLKLCKDVQEEHGYFNDRLVGEYAVEEEAIFDGSLVPDKYIEKYEDKDVSMQSYVSNIRMFIRITRILGWISYVPGKDGQYKLTDRGEVLTRFTGDFPDTRGGLSEQEIMLRSFANYCFYSVNDDPNYRDRRFKCRLFLNMLYFIQNFGFCHHHELAVTAFTLKDERDEEELQRKISILDRLREGEINIADAYRENDLDPNDSSTVNGVYDGPKVMLSFARQLGLAESTYISRMDDNDEIYEIYEQEYQGSPHIGIPKTVQTLTPQGEQFVDEEMGKRKIWFEEL